MKQTIKWFKFSLWKIIVLAAHGVTGLAYCQEFDNIFALSFRAPKKMSRKRGDFLKTYWAKWLRKQGAFFHGRTVKGVESNIFKCKPRSIFKTLGLIRLSGILSYTNHESGKFQNFQGNLRDNTTPRKGLITGAGEAMGMNSVLPAVLFLAWFIRWAGRQAWLLGNFPPGIPASQYWDPS